MCPRAARSGALVRHVLLLVAWAAAAAVADPQMSGQCYAEVPRSTACPPRSVKNAPPYTNVPAFLQRSPGHRYSSPAEVAREIDTSGLGSLFSTDCSNLAQTFFCTAYFPFCTPEVRVLSPLFGLSVCLRYSHSTCRCTGLSRQL